MAMIEQSGLAGGSHYVAPLTGIRAFAALLVLGFHINPNLPSVLSTFTPVVYRGFLGVDIFFILSGFIITHVYWSHLRAASARNIAIFLWHRFVRIYPVHVTVLLGLVILFYVGTLGGFVFNHPEAWQWDTLVTQVLLLQAWGFASPGWNVPSWSISAECFAYALFPVIAPILIFARSAAAAFIAAAGALVAFALVCKWRHWSLDIVGAAVLVRVFAEFVCGAALCRGVAHLENAPRHVGDILGICGLLVFFVGGFTQLSSFAILPFLALLVLGCAIADGAIAGLFASAPMVWLGEVSYSIYMVHMPVVMVLRRAWERFGFLEWGEPARLLAALSTAGLVVLAAAAMFYCVEWPIRMRLRDRFGKLSD